MRCKRLITISNMSPKLGLSSCKWVVILLTNRLLSGVILQVPPDFRQTIYEPIETTGCSVTRFCSDFGYHKSYSWVGWPNLMINQLYKRVGRHQTCVNHPPPLTHNQKSCPLGRSPLNRFRHTTFCIHGRQVTRSLDHLLQSLDGGQGWCLVNPAPTYRNTALWSGLPYHWFLGYYALFAERGTLGGQVE